MQKVPSEHQETFFFTVRVTKLWQRLFLQVVESLEIFRSQLDTVLGKQLYVALHRQWA